VPAGDVAEMLARQSEELFGSYRAISEEQSRFRYASGKWTIKQVLGHVSDVERVFAYRALAIARGEQQSLPSLDQDAYMAGANFDTRTWANLLDELMTVRAASISLFRSLGEPEQDRRGTASGNPVTVRALGFIIAGHERHHHEVLRSKYFAAPNYPS
jgi:uncharacterized damage-inducible protein DinB